MGGFKTTYKGPNLRSYLDKRISLHLNKGRKVIGTLRGYDQFMNIVLGDATEESNGNDNIIGMVVIRGNSIVQDEEITVTFMEDDSK